MRTSPLTFLLIPIKAYVLQDIVILLFANMFEITQVYKKEASGAIDMNKIDATSVL